MDALNSYIAIFSTTKYQNVPYNSGPIAFVRVSPNVHHAFTLLLVVVVVVFWWLNEILFYCNIYIILLC